MEQSDKTYWNLWIDTGGTFTDAIGIDPSGRRRSCKVLSSSALRGSTVARLEPGRYRIDEEWEAGDDLVAGMRFRPLSGAGEERGVAGYSSADSELRLESPLPSPLPEGAAFEVVSREEAPILAARLLTGTPPGRPLPPVRMRLATTRGTNALLEGEGSPVALLVTRGFRDLLRIGDQTRPDLFSLEVERTEYLPPGSRIFEIPERLDAGGEVLDPLENGLPEDLISFLDHTGGEVAAAVSLMHSYRNPGHEERLAGMLREAGVRHVSISSALSSAIGYLQRTRTAVVNARLQPVLEKYLSSVRRAVPEGTVHVMSSAGGLTRADRFQPRDGLLSGPAGGVVGAAAAGRDHGQSRVISFDMGGTSTDVSRYDGAFDYLFRHAVGGYTLNAPALSIETVAAGGGSVCRCEEGKLSVGPGSAGASPGPACYGAGGPLTVTDVNLLMGRLQPENFSIPIDLSAAKRRLREIVDALGGETDEGEVLEGFLRIANERMAEAVRRISLKKGYAPSRYTLVAFGGAGGQHACALAGMLDIDRVLVAREAGLLSAVGLGRAVIEHFAERQVLKTLGELKGETGPMMEELGRRAARKVADEGVEPETITVRRKLLFMRLRGQDSTIEVAWERGCDPEARFRRAYRKRYGHWVDGRAVEVESARAIASKTPPSPRRPDTPEPAEPPAPFDRRGVRFGGEERRTPVYRREQLDAGASIEGPAVVLDPYSTVVVEPGWRAVAGGGLTLERLRSGKEEKPSRRYAEAAELELFTNRFTSIAGEMGDMLRRTALSVNIKERMDFSCALLNAEGELIVNAPHIPVHLGALGRCVRALREILTLEPGDVAVTNHPTFGGSHLPDITVVTPLFGPSGNLLGYAASRAHHAEIGGTRPGSMPPGATSLAEEGVVIPPDLLVRRGEPRWEAIRQILEEGPWPSRAAEENIADLQAAVAANQRGREELGELARREGEERVLRYMNSLRDLAARKMRLALSAIPDMDERVSEYLDDGIPLRVRLRKRGEKIELDFEGTGGRHPGNLNATPAIVQSVVMYVLRVLVEEPLPLNEGLMDPLELRLPRCLLNPDFDADPARSPAVVGGNTEVSQRLVDLLLKPFGRAACSQGTMNNVLFGNERFGYYETVGGGTGAGPGFAGTDAVHHHMTNTAGTDPEILEHRYPVRLDRYAVRRGSGGEGRRRGGDGIERELTFLEPVSLSVLTQHRKESPYGLAGGEAGARGSQKVIRRDGTEEELDSVDGAELREGDRFRLLTPGGGGFAEKGEAGDDSPI